MIIPVESLDEATLTAILESFITREGTDYGESEFSLDEKVAMLRPQVVSGQVLIVYDEVLQSVNLVAQDQLSGNNLNGNDP